MAIFGRCGIRHTININGCTVILIGVGLNMIQSRSMAIGITYDRDGIRYTTKVNGYSDYIR